MIEKIKKIVGEDNIKIDYPLSRCSTFGIGGNATIYVTPTSISAIFKVVQIAKDFNCNYKVIGNASNILFSDDGYDGIVISLVKFSATIKVGDRSYLAAAGVSLTKLLNRAKEDGLSGLEFSAGIPGTLGGAIVMNAGANGSDISSLIKSVTYFDGEEIKSKKRDELEFSYRSSYFLKQKELIILFAELELEPLVKEEIENKINLYRNKRAQSQPKERSAGCVFKKCGDLPAGMLIDQAGLKGITSGGAKISEVHANFIVNFNGATAKDVKRLINLIEIEVHKKFRKKLELEIEIL